MELQLSRRLKQSIVLKNKLLNYCLTITIDMNYLFLKQTSRETEAIVEIKLLLSIDVINSFGRFIIGRFCSL